MGQMISCLGVSALISKLHLDHGTFIAKKRKVVIYICTKYEFCENVLAELTRKARILAR
ncbi:hypothetical protein GRF59_02445 [Paenibacillus sp. HJL G12]|uniref:Uncharacterized protein n=1 Tax=Paenibacillus dendrobii TaxID=2691084 RepID=A0A7X3IFR5_9BACL|nr:hypothetical protein [Paenibacillus dendrobii]MWV42481.1 hypothetical protein [Paenibacillus dendrobii]